MSRLIDADAFDKCLENAEAEAIHMRKHVFASAVNVIRGNLRSFPTIEPKTEAKPPRWVAEDRFVKGRYFEYPHCPKCNGELATGQCYCSICGQHINWDEEEGEADG